MGGGEYQIGFRENGQRESMRGIRFEAIRPLLETQPYITKVNWTDSQNGFTHDFSTFREHYQIHTNLAEQQAHHLRVPISLEPWLTVEPIKHGVTVIARSTRYYNPQFPWRRILGAYKERVFVGLEKEHQEFQSAFGNIEYYPTENILKLARLIAGANLVVSNQTCAWWLAAGLGKTVIQESYLSDLNSVIDRPNCVYTRNATEVNQLLDNL